MPFSAERWERITEIFESAMALPIEQRARFIRDTCPDGETASAVSQLIAEDGEAGEFLNRPAARVSDALETAAANRVGAVLQSRYQVLEEIARGGAGEVYLALDLMQQTEVVIKLLREEALENRWLRRKFRSEAEALGRLDHPNIVRILDFGETEQGEPFLVMEYVRGVTLRSELQQGPLTLARSAAMLRAIGAAAGFAHQSGIVHRDLKPENIMLVSAGEIETVKVIDFGIAQVRGGHTDTETGIRLAAGTTRYMAPEQLLGEASPSSDVYAIGVIAYEMVAGFPPHTQENAIEILKQQGAGRIRDLRDIRPEISGRAWRLIRRAMSFSAGDRPKEASELANALALALGHRARLSRVIRWAGRRATPVIAAALIAAGVIAWRQTSFQNRGPSLTQLTFDTGLTTEPALSRDGQMLAYVSDRAGEGKLDLWSQPIHSRVPLRLTHRAGNVGEPSFSPDGQTIAFVSEPDGGIYLVPTRGGPERRIYEGPAHRPRFSPDGKWIAFWSGTERSGDPFARGTTAAFMVPAAGGEWREICPSCWSSGYPVWSPDSKAILFAGLREPKADVGEFQWMLAPLQPGPPVEVAAAADISMHYPDDWLSDGRVVANSAYPADPVPAELWDIAISPLSGRIDRSGRHLALKVPGDAGPVAVAMGATVTAVLTHKTDLAIVDWNGNSRRIVSDAGDHQFLDLSADGRRLFYDSRRPGSSTLMMLRPLPGSESTRVAAHERFYWPIASQTGDAVYYVIDGRLFRASTSGAATPVCAAISRLWDVSPDQHYLLHMSTGRSRQIGVMDLRSCRDLEPLAHPDWNLYLGRFSPDGNWILFEAKSTPGHAGLYASPFRPGVKSDPSTWIAVSDGKTFDGPGRWTPDGRGVVYLSKRDGFQCLWSQRLDSRKRPLGDPVAVWHLHSATQYMDREFTVARDKIAVILHERGSNLWLVK